jgi:hypothetical protein
VVIVGWGTVDREGRVTLTMSNGSTTDPNLPVRLSAVAPSLRPLDVRLPYSDAQPMPVGITRITSPGAWPPIRVAVEGQPIRVAVEGEPLRPRPGR